MATLEDLNYMTSSFTSDFSKQVLLAPALAGADPPLDIVVVEDHDLLRQELVAFLQRPSWNVRGVDCADALDEALRQRPADVLVVDLNLPGEDGISICERMRQAMPSMGLIILTARTRPGDRSTGYQTGADVYLTKPAHVDELEAVITNLARRIQRQAASGFLLDMVGLNLSDSTGIKVGLTRLEAQLLRMMALAPERKVDSDVLLLRLNQIAPAPVTRENLAVVISRLRSKISASLGGQDVIKAVRSYGYQVTAIVTVQEFREQ